MNSLLFDRFKEGDERVLGSYFDKHVKALLLFAYQIVLDEGSSEELVQDAYIKLWSNRTNIENESHLKSFLYTVVRRGGVDLLRKRKGFSSVSIEESGDLFLDSHDSPLAHIIHVETLQLIYNEINRLPKSQQLVFKFAFIDGLTTEEICKELSMSPNAVFIAKSKALSTLKRVFRNNHMSLFLFSLLFGSDLSN